MLLIILIAWLWTLQIADLLAQAGINIDLFAAFQYILNLLGA